MDAKKMRIEVEKRYSSYRKSCAVISKKAQQYVDWDDDLGCEYFPSDGVCLTTSDAKVCPADSFFDIAEDQGYISESEFESICI